MSLEADWPWSALGLDAPSDLRTIKSAYAARLKQIDRNDPVAFQALQSAFQSARAHASQRTLPARPNMADLIRNEPILSRSQAFPDFTQGQSDCPSSDGDALAADRETQEFISLPTAQATPEASNLECIHDGAHDDAFEQEDAPLAQEGLQKEDIWWCEFEAHLSWPWDTKALDRLLSQELAQHNHQLRHSAEVRMYFQLAEELNNKTLLFDTAVVNLLEKHFQWSQDTTTLSHHVGIHDEYKLIMHAYHRSLPKNKYFTEIYAKKYINYTRIAILFSLLMLTLFNFRFITKDNAGAVDFIALFVVHLLLYLLFLFLNFLTALVFRLLWIPTALAYIGSKVAPKFTEKISRYYYLPEIIRWVAALVMCVIFASLIAGQE